LEAFTISSAGMALGMVLPVQLGMATARTLGTYMHGRPLRRGTAGTLVEQGFDFLVVAGLAVASAAVWFCHGGAFMWTLCAAAMTALGLLAAQPLIGLLQWLARWLGAKNKGSSGRLARLLREVELSGMVAPALARRLLVLSTLRFGVVVLMAEQTAHAIHAQIPLWQMAAAVPFVALATVIAITPGGIGVNELTSVTVLRGLGIPLATAVQWSVANRILCTASCFTVAAIALVLFFAGVASGLQGEARQPKTRGELRHVKRRGTLDWKRVGTVECRGDIAAAQCGQCDGGIPGTGAAIHRSGDFRSAEKAQRPR
jgi:uncharacterized membrane protein YbhN (UPF0104 family)